jgi:hypothetical protein
MLVPAGADCIWRRISSTALTSVVELQNESVESLDMTRPWVCILLSDDAKNYLTWGVIKYTQLVLAQSKTRPRTFTVHKKDCVPSIVLSPPYVFDNCCPIPSEFSIDDAERLMRERYTESGEWRMANNLLSYRLCVHAVSQSNSGELLKRFLDAERKLAIQRLTWDQMALVLTKHSPTGGYIQTQQGRRITHLYDDVCSGACDILELSKHQTLEGGLLVAKAPLFISHVLRLIGKVHIKNIAYHRTIAVDERLLGVYFAWRLTQIPLLPPPVPPKPLTKVKRPDGIEIEQCLPACMRELWEVAFNPKVKEHLKHEERNVFYRFVLRMGMVEEEIEAHTRAAKSGKGLDDKYINNTVVPAIQSTAKFLKRDGMRDDSCGKIMERTKNAPGGGKESMCPFHRSLGSDWKSARQSCHVNQTAIVKRDKIGYAEGNTPIAVADNIAKHLVVEMTD